MQNHILVHFQKSLRLVLVLSTKVSFLQALNYVHVASYLVSYRQEVLYINILNYPVTVSFTQSEFSNRK